MNAVTKLLAKAGQQVMKIKPIAKLAVKVSKNKPELCLYGGIAAVLVAFGLAIGGGMKVKERMEISAEKVEELERQQAEKLNVEDLTDEQKDIIIRECNRDLKKARRDGIWQVSKLFILPGGLLVVGLILIGGGHRILKKRNVVLAAAAEGYKKTLEFYRKNVVAAEGEEADLKYLRGVVGEKNVETVTKDEEGKENKSIKKVPVVKDNKDHKIPWRFMFNDIYFDSYDNDTQRNLFFLKCANEWWQHEFERRGDEGICMYDILKYLGYNFNVDRDGMTKEQYRDWITFLRNYGWRKGCGDGFIDFGLYRAINEAAMAGKTDMVWIEFNCSGNLQDLTVRK